MSSRKQGAVFCTCRDSEVWEAAALHQCLPSVCNQAGLAAAWSPGSWLPDHTPAHQGGSSGFGSLHLSTGTQAQRGPRRERHQQAGHRTADSSYWGEDGRTRVREEVVGTAVSGVVIKETWDWACGEMKSRMWIFSGSDCQRVGNCCRWCWHMGL